MNSINTVCISGRVGHDPEMRFTTNGAAVCEARIAVNHSWKGKDDKWQESVAWVTIVAWQKTAERLVEVKKGDLIMVEGRLNGREWEDKNTGEKRSKLEVVANRVERLIAGKKAETADESEPF